MSWFGCRGTKPPPLKRRLIRDIDPRDVNDTIRELEDDGYTVMNVLSRVIIYQTKQGPEASTMYDILVSGESDPLWASWSDRG